MVKRLRLPDYNYDFDTNTGLFIRWGKDKETDPQYSPIGPEILDIEVTTICNGTNGKLCQMCYKSNNPIGKNMSLETFKLIIDKMPKTLLQLAIGADSEATSNPDLFKMMEYCRFKDIVPNITVANITEETAKILASLCGAVAVSNYDIDICKRSISYLHKYGLKQINVHQCVATELLDNCYDIMDEAKNIPGLNAIVMLSLKQKGRGKNFNPLPYHLFKDMIDYAMNKKIPIGFDSCTAHKFLKYVNESGNDELKKLAIFVEPCESMLFSTYIDVDARCWPCSFATNTKDYLTGIDMLSVKDYMTDVWNSEQMIRWRKELLENTRKCPIYNI
jgi:hypothetical protein